MPGKNKPLRHIEAVLESIEFEMDKHLQLALLHQEKAATLKDQHAKLRLAILREREQEANCAGC